MKALLVAAREGVRQRLSECLADSAVDLVQYWQPIKAMDNLEELAPDLVFFSAQDFPRHWKPFLVFLRADHPKNEVPFILLFGTPLSPEELSAANFLDANDILGEGLDNDRDQGLVRQAAGLGNAARTQAGSGGGARSYSPVSEEGAEILFVDPRNLRLVAGRITAITSEGFTFVPTSTLEVDFPRGAFVADASLRFGNQIHSVDFEVVNLTNRNVSCFFRDLPPALAAALSTVLTT